MASPDWKGWSQFHQQRQRETWTQSLLQQPTAAGPAPAEAESQGRGSCQDFSSPCSSYPATHWLTEFPSAMDKSQSSNINFYSRLLILRETTDSLTVAFQVEEMTLDGRFLKSPYTRTYLFPFWKPPSLSSMKLWAQLSLNRFPWLPVQARKDPHIP